nr:MAG: hypothetical protein [Cressdnaviricota sp.]
MTLRPTRPTVPEGQLSGSFLECPDLQKKMSEQKQKGLLTKWDCSCFCCSRMREEYHELAYRQINDIIIASEKRINEWRQEIDILKNQISAVEDENIILKTALQDKEKWTEIGFEF